MSIFITTKEKKKFFADLYATEYSSLLAPYRGITPDMASPLDESIFYDSLFQRGQQALYFQAEYPQTSSATPSCNNPLSIFVAHTYEDGRVVQKVDQILRTIAYQEENINYRFGEIALDMRWKKSRHDYLTSVDLILLLVTKAFIATEYCYSPQLKWAILRHSEEKAYIIPVLLTGDDEARLREQYFSKDDPDAEKVLMPQPRQNVLFEAGMAFGLQRNRTVLVELGTLRGFSDASGRYAIRLDNTSAKRNELAQRLKSIGCDVHLEGNDWLFAGNFNV